MLAHHPALASPSYQDVVLAVPGLVAYWPCDDMGATFRDLKGGGGVGTLSGTVGQARPDITGRTGPSVGFTGVANSRVAGTGTTLPNSGASDTWTFFGWVFCTALPTASAHLFGFGTNAGTAGSNGAKHKLMRYSNRINYWGENADVAGTELDVGKPMFLAASRTAAGLVTLSKNGASIGSGSPTYLGTGGQDWQIGAKPHAGAAGAELTSTRISHFGISNQTLTLTDLRHLYAEGIR